MIDTDNQNPLGEDRPEPLSTTAKLLYGAGIAVLTPVLLYLFYAIFFKGTSTAPAPTPPPAIASSALPPQPGTPPPAENNPFALPDDPAANPFADMQPAPGLAAPVAPTRTPPATEPLAPPPGPDPDTTVPPTDTTESSPPPPAPTTADNPTQSDPEPQRVDTPAAPAPKTPDTQQTTSAQLASINCPDCDNTEEILLKLTYIHQLANMMVAIKQSIGEVSPGLTPLLKEIVDREYPEMKPLVPAILADINQASPDTGPDQTLDETAIVDIIRNELKAQTPATPEPSDSTPPAPAKASLNDIRIVYIRSRQQDNTVAFDRAVVDIDGRKTFLTQNAAVEHGPYDLVLDDITPAADPRRGRPVVKVRDRNTGRIHRLQWLRAD